MITKDKKDKVKDFFERKNKIKKKTTHKIKLEKRDRLRLV